MAKRSISTERVYGRLPEIYTAADALNDETLKNYLASVLDQYDEIQKYIARFEYIPEQERQIDPSEYTDAPVYHHGYVDESGNPVDEKGSPYATITNLATNPSFEATSTAPFEVRRNLCNNPSFETDLNGWTGGSTGTRERFASVSTFVGSYIMRITRNSTTPGNCYAAYNSALAVGTYTWSFYTRIVSGSPTYQTLISTSGGAVVTGGGGQTVAFVGSNWVRVARTFTVTTAGTVSLIFRDDGSPLVEVGQAVDLDAVLIEQTSTLGPYFDGSTSPDSTMTPAWLGTANASASVLRSTQIEVYRNLATNPSFEATSGTVEVRRNLASDPLATVAGNIPAGQARWTARWFGTGGGAGTTTAVSGASDGPLPGISTYLRKTWTVAGGIGDTGFDHAAVGVTSATPLTTGFPVVAGRTYTFSSWIRASRRPGTANVDLRVIWRDAGGERILPAPSRVLSAITPGVWQRVSITLTAPANAVTASIATDIEGGGATWEPGDTLDGTALLIEESPTLGDFFAPGLPSPDPDLTPAWAGAANASPSVLTGAGVTFVASAGSRAIASSQWASHGTRSMRIIPSFTTNDSNVRVAGSPTSLTGAGVTFVAGRTYTVMARLRLAAPQTGALNLQARRIRAVGNTVAGWTGVTNILSTQAPNTAGVHEQRLTFTIPVNAVWWQVDLFNGAWPNGGDVWWDDLVIIENEYAGPYFDGSTSPDSDLTPAWTGTANASASVLTGVAVTGFNDGNPDRARRFSSQQWAARGTRSIRVVPLTTDPMVTYAEYVRSGLTVGQTYTLIGTVRLAAPQTGPLSPDPSRPPRGFWVTGTPTNPVTVQTRTAPNAAGVHEARATFVATSTTHGIRLMNGAAVGGGDVWWDNLAIIEGEYNGEWFDGDVPTNEYAIYGWTVPGSGTGTSHRTLTGVPFGTVGVLPPRPIDLPLGSTSDLVNPVTADDAWLPWIQQFFPVQGSYSNMSELRGALIAASEDYNRGSIPSILSAVRQLLDGSRAARIYKRANLAGFGGSATMWDVLVVTSPGEYTGTSMHDDLSRMGAKPAGVVIHHRIYSTDWDTIESEYPTWDAIEDKTWQTIEMTGL